MRVYRIPWIDCLRRSVNNTILLQNQLIDSFQNREWELMDQKEF